MPHHKYGPSTLKHLEICPRWERQPDSGGYAAEEGTLLHAACETENLAGLDEEQKYAVTQCLDYVNGLLATASVSDDLREILLELRGVDGNVLTFGTADRLIIHAEGTAADLVDYKFGRNSVGDAENNVQGQAYAVGAFQDFPKLETVTVHFLLPRRDEITTAQYARAKLDTLFLRVATIIARAEELAVPPNPDSENCLYCGAKARCPALAERALVYARHADQAVLPQIWNPRDIADPNVLAGALRAAPLLEEWCKQVKAEGVARVNSGQHIPGFVLRRRSGGREIVDPIGVLTQAEHAGVDRSDLINTARWSLTAIRELISAKIPQGEKTKALDAFDQEIAAYVAQRPDTEYLAREKKAKA